MVNYANDTMIDYNQVSNNTNSAGIALSYIDHANIYKNTCTLNGDAIDMNYANDTIIDNNNCTRIYSMH